MRSGLAIVLLSVAAAVVYGIVHDQVTARVSLEYFTIGHPPVFATEDPTLLALGWGVLATWWVGLLLGVPLALAARRGPEPRRAARSLVRPIAVLLALMAGCALGFGVLGWLLGRGGAVYLLAPLASEVPADRHARYLGALWAHLASYAAGFAGGLALVCVIWRGRARERAQSLRASTLAASTASGKHSRLSR